MNWKLEIVNDQPELWKDGDPVRPSLGVTFKTYPGRTVFGLKNETGGYDAFCCVAKTYDVPYDITSLSSLTSEDGSVCVPYTVWSTKRGGGRAIINALIEYIKQSMEGIRRVVTLSPNTDMARNFHLRNGATEIKTHVVTANFEYSF